MGGYAKPAKPAATKTMSELSSSDTYARTAWGVSTLESIQRVWRRGSDRAMTEASCTAAIIATRVEM